MFNSSVSPSASNTIAITTLGTTTATNGFAYTDNYDSSTCQHINNKLHEKTSSPNITRRPFISNMLTWLQLRSGELTPTIPAVRDSRVCQCEASVYPPVPRAQCFSAPSDSFVPPEKRVVNENLCDWVVLVRWSSSWPRLRHCPHKHPKHHPTHTPTVRMHFRSDDGENRSKNVTPDPTKIGQTFVWPFLIQVI